MKRYLAFGLLLVSLACGGGGHPASTAPVPLGDRWRVIIEVGGESIAIDTASVTRLDASEYRVWITTTFASVREIAGMRYRALRKLVDYRCGARLARIHRTVILDQAGRQVRVSEYPDPNQARYVALTPETISEVEYVAVCAFLS